MAAQEQNNVLRQAMLTSIRQHLATSAPYDVVRDEHLARHEGEPQSDHLTKASLESAMSLLELFSSSLAAVAGHCVVVRDQLEAAEAVRDILVLTKAKRGAISDSGLVRRVVERINSNVELFENLKAADLFDCDVGITSAQWAVAETGTLVLDGEVEWHRLASLVPPVHIAIIEAGRIRRTLAEVLESLGQRKPDQLSRTVTFITGPSRTSDIELNLAIGVHGPGELHVVILEG